MPANIPSGCSNDRDTRRGTMPRLFFYHHRDTGGQASAHGTECVADDDREAARTIGRQMIDIMEVRT